MTLPSSSRRVFPGVERAAISLGIAVLFVVGYSVSGWLVDPGRARSLGTTVDARIPFISDAVWVYQWVFPAAVMPLFVVRCRSLFRRGATAYVLAIVISLVIFLLFPVTSYDLRVDPTNLNLSRRADGIVSFIYRIDTAYNLFPSLHLSIATIATGCVWRASRPLGSLAFVALVMLAASVCLVKQHFVVDAIAGLALGGALYAWLVAPYHPPADATLAYSWHGPMAYAATVAVYYIAQYAVFGVPTQPANAGFGARLTAPLNANVRTTPAADR